MRRHQVEQYRLGRRIGDGAKPVITAILLGYLIPAIDLVWSQIIKLRELRQECAGIERDLNAHRRSLSIVWLNR